LRALKGSYADKPTIGLCEHKSDRIANSLDETLNGNLAASANAGNEVTNLKV
jgi:hypothetical protein